MIFDSTTTSVVTAQRKLLMLKSVTIHRFRSCIELSLSDLTALTALVGRNGAGKTNILKAIEWLARLVADVKPTREQYFYDDNGSASFTVELKGKTYSYFVDKRTEYIADQGDRNSEAKFTFEERLTVAEHGVEQVLFLRSGEKIELPGPKTELSLSVSSSAVGGLIALLRDADPIKADLAALTQFFSKVVYYPLELVDPKRVSFGFSVISEDDFVKWSTSVDNTSSSDETLMRVLKLFLKHRDAFEELKSLMGDHGLKLLSQIEVVEVKLPANILATKSKERSVDAERKHYFLRFIPCGAVTAFNFGDLSFGTRRVLQLVVSVLADGASVALIEQPEDGIHPGLLHKLTPLLRAYSADHQFVLASHSPDVLDRLNPEEIRLVEMHEGISRARALDASELTIAHEYLADEGPLSDFLESL